MKQRVKLVISTAIMGQVWSEQWREVVELTESIIAREKIEARVGLELVAAFREPLLSLIIRRLKQTGLANKVMMVHGRVDYDLEAFKSRLGHFKGIKRLELVAYDTIMPWVGEAYRATLKLPKAKLLLHAPTMWQMAVAKGRKPRLRGKRLAIENDEKLTFPFGDEELSGELAKLGDPLNPVDIFKFAQKRNCAKVVFDTAHFWRCFPAEAEREKIWKEFKSLAEKSDLPVYWHMNHDNGKHFEIYVKRGGFVSEHDWWLGQVCKFIGSRVRRGRDQICLEEPRRIALVLSSKTMKEITEGIERSIVSLKEFGAL